jgi:ribosome-binding factor A
MSRKVTSRPPSQRQLKVGETVRHALSQFLQRHDFFDPILEKTIINLTEVRMSPDLKHARIYVLPLQGIAMGEVVAALNEHAPTIRQGIAKELTLKFMPALRFVEDDSFFETQKVEALLNSPHVKQDLGPKD